MYIKTNSLFKGTVLFAMSSFLLSAAQMGALSSNNYGSTQIGGTVYQELPVNGSHKNSYGVKDSNEPGIPGVKVKVTDTAGHTVTTTTNSQGRWSVNMSGKVRVEFSNWPSYLDSAPYGGSSATSVQFTNVKLY